MKSESRIYIGKFDVNADSKMASQKQIDYIMGLLRTINNKQLTPSQVNRITATEASKLIGFLLNHKKFTVVDRDMLRQKKAAKKDTNEAKAKAKLAERAKFDAIRAQVVKPVTWLPNKQVVPQKVRRISVQEMQAKLNKLEANL